MSELPALPTFKMAAPHLGCSSAAALRRRFERGIYPARFRVMLTDRLPGVDLPGLVDWIKSGRPADVTQEAGR